MASMTAEFSVLTLGRLFSTLACWRFSVASRSRGAVAHEEVEGELDEVSQRVPRLHAVELELLLGGAGLSVGLLQDREIELLLRRKVVIDHALVDGRAIRDVVGLGSLVALVGELAVATRMIRARVARASGVHFA